ncbi:glycosyltransferase [uncultured Algibacter sp.]|uniref:glycosyltransferase family 2 protein n=1 Tax=uncultured Algibacter sp. TaxID=298659 RepID=UPI00262A9339|nr:glycosyltransferase [uncultured Algibacter sp.]
MNSEPLISIIIPTYNRENTIAETLDSVLSQTYANWECIAVDDGSTDSTINILDVYSKKDSRFQYFQRPSHKEKGANSCRNYGFEKSKGSFIQWLDSDDLLSKFCFEKRVQTILEKQLDFVVASTAYLNNNNSKEEIVNQDSEHVTNEDYLIQFLSYNLPWCILSPMWKRSIISEFHFDENLQRFQDVDFHIRILASNKFKFDRLYEIDTYYRIGLNNPKGDLHVKKVLNSFVPFFNKIQPLTDSNPRKKHFRTFVSTFLFSQGFPNFILFKEEVKAILKIIYKSNTYNLYQKGLVAIESFILDKKLYKIKGIGLYRLRTWIKSQLLPT